MVSPQPGNQRGAYVTAVTALHGSHHENLLAKEDCQAVSYTAPVLPGFILKAILSRETGLSIPNRYRDYLLLYNNISLKIQRCAWRFRFPRQMQGLPA